MGIFLGLTARIIEMLVRFSLAVMLELMGCIVRLLYWSVRRYGWGRVGSFLMAFCLSVGLSQQMGWVSASIAFLEFILISTLVIWLSLMASYWGLSQWWRNRAASAPLSSRQFPLMSSQPFPSPNPTSSPLPYPTTSDTRPALPRVAPSEQPLPLWQKVLHSSTLHEAWRRVLVRNGGPGSDGERVEDFALAVDHHLAQLREELLRGSYRPRAPKWVEVPKPNGKVRRLAVLCVRDRIVQQALLMVLTPLWDAKFAPCSYAYRPGKSALQAVAAVEESLRNGQVWVLDGDIESFFDSVPHEPLFAYLKDWVDDERVYLWLRVCVSGTSPSQRQGLAQGAPLSPLLANLYLHPFDTALLQSGYRLIRYADDFVVLCPTRPQAEAALQMTERLLGRLGLRLNAEKTRIVHRDEGFTFLGYEFTKEGKRPSERAIASLRERLMATEDETKRRQIWAGWQGYFGRELSDLPAKVDSEVQWVGEAGANDSELWWEEIEGHTEFSVAEVEPQLGIYRERFCGRSDVFARYWQSGNRKGYAPVRRAIGDEDLMAHLSGDTVLGIYLLRPDGAAKVLVFDIDGPDCSEAGKGKAFALAQKIVEQLRQQSVVPIWEDSGGKGFHLWLCFDQFVNAAEMRRWATKWLDRFRPFPEGVLVEIFPKQDRLAPNALGSLLRLPLGRHPETGQFSRLLNEDGNPVDNPWKVLAETPLLSPTQLLNSPAVSLSANLPEPPEAVAPMVKGCSLLWGLVEKAAREHHLRHVERLALLYTLGHCGEAGHAYLHQIIALCSNYNPRITERWLQRVDPGHHPLRCATLREWLKDLLPGVCCPCVPKSKDPSPLDLLRQSPAKTRKKAPTPLGQEAWEKIAEDLFGDALLQGEA